MSLENNRKAIKSGLWYTISNFVVKSIGFITTPIFTRLMTPSEFGDYSNYLSWQNIAVIVMTLNLEATLVCAKYDYERKFDQYLFSILSLSGLSVGVWFGIYVFFNNAISMFLKLDHIYILLMYMYILFHPAIVLFQARECYFYRYKSNVFVSVLVAVGSSLLSVILVIFLGNKLSGRIVGSVVPTIIIGLGLWSIFAYRGKRIDVNCWGYAIKISLPYIPHLLSLTLLNSVDRIMITRINGSYYTALYSLAYNSGAIVTLLITSMNNAFSPWLADKIHSQSKADVRSISKKYIILFCYFVIGIMLIAPEILSLLGGKKYADAKYIMPPITMGCVCQFLYTLFVNIEQYKKSTIGMAIASISAAALNYTLNLVFIPLYGYHAAAYTTLIGYLWLLIIHMYLVRRLQMSDYYDYKFVFATTGMMIGITVIVNCLYFNTEIRFLCIMTYILIGITILFQNRVKLMEMFMNNKYKGI